MYLKSNEKGFTLIEMLLVLSVVMVITSSLFIFTTSYSEKVEERRFFRQFHLDIQRLQAIAIAEQKYTYILFYAGRDGYVARSQNVDLFETDMPESVRLSSGSYLKDVYFHPNGAVKQFGSFLFETKNGDKKVTINIGQGRLNYEE